MHSSGLVHVPCSQPSLQMAVEEKREKFNFPFDILFFALEICVYIL